MITDHGANLILTDWIDDHAEMLSAWETEARLYVGRAIFAQTGEGRFSLFPDIVDCPAAGL